MIMIQNIYRCIHKNRRTKKKKKIFVQTIRYVSFHSHRTDVAILCNSLRAERIVIWEYGG